MRILLINQFYPPDVAPTGAFLHDLARALVGAGHDVSVLCSRWGYGGGGPFAAREARDGAVVRRVSGVRFGRGMARRAASGLTFAAGALPRVMAGARPDVVVTMTSPPGAGLLGALAARWRGVAHVHWAMDLYPDVIEAAGLRGGLLPPLLRALTRWQMAGTRLVLAPAPSMARRLSDRVPAGVSVAAVPLWARGPVLSAGEALAQRRRLDWPLDRLVLLYAGNMGLGHRFEEFLDAARTLGSDGPAWIFAGGGPRRGEIAEAVAGDPHGAVWLLPYADPEEHAARRAAADVHLMSLRSSWDGLVVPSKLQAAFGLARPVIFVGSRTGEPGSWIEEAGGGWVVAEGDTPGLLRAVAEAQEAGERARRGASALAFARARFSPEANVARLVRLIEHGR